MAPHQAAPHEHGEQRAEDRDEHSHRTPGCDVGAAFFGDRSCGKDVVIKDVVIVGSVRL